MEKTDVILIIISIISSITSAIFILIDFKEFIGKEILYKNNLKNYKEAVKDFQVCNKNIDNSVTENLITMSQKESYNLYKEIVEKYIDVLYRFIKSLYNDNSISVSVMIFDKNTMVLSNYLTINAQSVSNNETHIELRMNKLFDDIINQKYHYAFIIKSNNAKQFENFESKTQQYASFISYPICNNEHEKPIGLINISSQNEFDNAKLNKIIISTLSETAQDLSKLNLKKYNI